MQPMDDDLWELAWERHLSAPERNAIARAVWFGRPIDDAFEARIAAELPRRWRRRAISLAALYSLWTAFWGAIAVQDLAQPPPVEPPLPLYATTAGLLAILACAWVFRRVGRGPRTRG